MVEIKPDLKAFIETPVSNSFGLTIDEVAKKCRYYGRFKAWLNGDLTKVKQVLTTVKNAGVSPAFFASYERSEGYNSKWGWLNHTVPQGNPVQDAESVSKWIIAQSQNMNSKPAWIDYANYKDFVPADVKREGDEHFKNIKKGGIGRVLIAGTAAATWEVYYPLGLKAEYNGVQNYAPPIQVILDSIVQWGGKVTGGSAYQLAMMPMQYINVTQGENGQFSHRGTLCIDFTGQAPRFPYYAPCACTCINLNVQNAYLIWKSDKKVMCADGKVRNLVWSCIHENPPATHKVGTKLKQGDLMGYSGTGGFATGDHFHLNVIEGSRYTGFTYSPDARLSGKELHIYETFSITPETIFGNDGGYKWIISDYDGSDGGDPPDKTDNGNNDIINLLLCGALNGWGQKGIN